MKEIKILAIVVIVLVCILGVKIIFFNNVNHEYTKDEIIALLKEGEDYNNYSCRYTLLDNDYETIRMIKEKKKKLLEMNLLLYTLTLNQTKS